MCQHSWFLLEAPEENMFPCFCQLLEATCNFLIYVPVLEFSRGRDPIGSREREGGREKGGGGERERDLF